MTAPTGPSPAGGDGTGHEETTEFLLQSLRDLEAERDAGDIDEDDYIALRDDYTARAAAALRAEERGRPAPVSTPPDRPWTHRLLVVAGVVAFAVLSGVLVAQAVGRRDAGQGITGEVVQTPTQQASACIDLTAQDRLVDALPCYEEVLAEDPDNAVARTYLGWTLFLTARQGGSGLPEDVVVDLYLRARDQLDRAVEADPGYADARAFQVVLAVREGRFEEAARHLEAFDELDAPADVRGLVDGLRQEVTDGLAAEDVGAEPGPGDPAPPASEAPPTSAPSGTTAPG